MMRAIPLIAFLLLGLLVRPGWALNYSYGGGGNCADIHTTICFFEEFTGGNGTTGQIGTHGWSLIGTGSYSTTTSVKNDFGVGNILTGGALNNAVGLFSNGVNPIIDLAFQSIKVEMRALADVTSFGNYRLGLTSNTAPAVALNSGVYFETLAGETTWFCVTRNAGAQTRTNTGISNVAPPPDASIGFLQRFMLEKVPAGWRCTVEGTSVTNTTNFPSSGQQNLFLSVHNSGTAEVDDMEIDYFFLQLGGVVR